MLEYLKALYNSIFKNDKKEDTRLDKNGKQLDNFKKLDCKTIKACRLKLNDGVSIKLMARELNIADSTLGRAISGKTYKDCLENK